MKIQEHNMHGAPTFTSGFFVLDKHIPALNIDNAMVRYGHLKNIGRKVFDTCFTVNECAGGTVTGDPMYEVPRRAGQISSDKFGVGCELFQSL